MVIKIITDIIISSKSHTHTHTHTHIYILTCQELDKYIIEIGKKLSILVYF